MFRAEGAPPPGYDARALSLAEAAMTPENTRIEHDLLGDRAVPAQAYYGVHTLRALENFPITGTTILTRRRSNSV